MRAMDSLWVTLSSSPLVGLLITLIAYQCGLWCFQRAKHASWANPILIAILMIMLFLWLTHTPYTRYFESAQFIHFLLGPATVALAIPLYSQIKPLKEMAGPLVISLCIGSIVTALSAVGITYLLGGSAETMRSISPKSVTTPIAMGIAEKIGGLPSLAAVLVIITGIVGAIIFPTLFKRLKIESHAAQGFAVGLTSHGLGTARAFLFSEEMGAFAALAMGLNGLFTALWLPILFRSGVL